MNKPPNCAFVNCTLMGTDFLNSRNYCKRHYEETLLNHLLRARKKYKDEYPDSYLVMGVKHTICPKLKRALQNPISTESLEEHRQMLILNRDCLCNGEKVATDSNQSQ